MVYYRDVNYRTPTTKNDILSFSTKRSSQEQSDDKAHTNNDAPHVQQNIEPSDMTKLNATGRIRPRSNNINILTKQELD